MRKYLFFKIFIGFVLIFAFYHILFYSILLRTFKTFYLKNLEKNYKELAEKIQNDIEKEEFLKLNEELKRIDKYTNTRITLIDINGNVLADTRENPRFMENHKNRPEFIEAIEKGVGKSVRLSPTLNKYMFYYGVFLKEREIVLRLSTELDYIQNVFSDFKRSIGPLILILFFILLFVYFIFLRFSIEGLSLIENFIMKLGNGKYDEKLIGIKSKRLKNFVEVLNRLSENLYSMSKFKGFEKGFYEVIELIEEPVAIFDLDGKFLMCNFKFEGFLKNPSRDKYFWEIIENFTLNEVIEKTINQKGKFEKEIEIEEKWYYLKSFYLNNLKIILLLLVDITKLKEIEKLRKEFITNISHELKTPLSIVKGYIETLEEEVENGECKKYANIVKSQTERLIKIVENITALSQTETGKLDLEDVNLKEVIKEVYELFKKRADEKNIQFILKVEDVPIIRGDRFKIEQAIINLVDNAIKFTDKGKVEINLSKMDRYILIEVIDSGVGIAEEDLPKLFEKFYIGTKKKPQSGTGIGLYIVKNIVDLHNGKIEVESKINEGSKFSIFLPL